jgi:hypothetical protein
LDFASYEIWNFIEQVLRVTVEDLSLFREFNGTPTGTVIAQLTDDIPLERLSRFNGATFKGVAVEARLFDSVLSFQKFLRLHSEVRSDPLSKLLRGGSPPLVYVLNFDGADDDLKRLFSSCGEISLTMSYPYRQGKFHTIYFVSDVAARLACRTFNGYDRGRLVVALLHIRAAERAFRARHVEDVTWLRDEAGAFGKVEEMRGGDAGEVFILMETLDAARAACTLINGRVVGGKAIATNFVDRELFKGLPTSGLRNGCRETLD